VTLGSQVKRTFGQTLPKNNTLGRKFLQTLCFVVEGVKLVDEGLVEGGLLVRFAFGGSELDPVRLLECHRCRGCIKPQRGQERARMV